MGLGADVTLYSKPATLDAAYGNKPVSFQIFLRMQPAKIGGTSSSPMIEEEKKSYGYQGLGRRIIR